ncbi:MAG: hypothetical protein ACI9FB_003959, partial [Candidatus Azotimanducaceae bacterium]
MLAARLIVVPILLSINCTAIAEQWEEVPRGKQRLKAAIEAPEAVISEVVDPFSEPETLASIPLIKSGEGKEDDKIPSVNALYPSGEGEITGAFGINFDEPMKSSVVISELGWRVASKLPDGIVYKGSDLALDFETFHVNPPAVPEIMASKGIVYRTTTDFQGHPLSITAERISNIKDIRAILKRKYGEPSTETKSLITFIRGDKALYIKIKRNRVSLEYYNLEALRSYVKRREVSLRVKSQESTLEQITLTEQRIFLLAEQFMKSRKNGGDSFGFSFDNRVGFLAKPDEYVELIGAKALQGVNKGAYSIMVSPDLMPIIMRYELEAPKSELVILKTIFDSALSLTYGGFLKKSANHSVIAFSLTSISVMIRSGKLSLSIINSAENKS